jgi:hypothetical protein
MKTETFNNQATATGHSNDKRDPFECLKLGFMHFTGPVGILPNAGAFKTAVRVSVSRSCLST